MARPSTIDRNALLDAAERVITGEAAGRLTIDAVAAEAGVSKGGVLYSFPSKDALIQALVERYVATYDADIDQAATLRVDGLRAGIRAYVDAVRPATDAERRSTVAILAAAAHNPALLAPLQDFYRRHRARIDAHGQDDEAFIAFLAVEGLVMLELLGLTDFSAEQWTRVKTALDRLLGSV